MIEKLEKLIKECNDEYELLLVQTSVDDFVRYVNTVIDYAVKIPIAQESFRYDRDRLIAEIERYDHARHYAHEAAIAGCSSLNRLCELKGVEPIAQVNTEDRHEVARFVGDFINEIYNDCVRGGMDRAVELAKEAPYPQFKIER